MISVLLALCSPASAAEVQVASRVPISILVDGVAMAWDENAGVGFTGGLPAGVHSIEARNLFGKTMARAQVHLSLTEQVRFEYRKKKLRQIGIYAIESAVAYEPPLAIPPAIPEESTTTVVHTTTTTTGMPGVGITLSDGHDTVSVGAGIFGGGVQVTETTTTSTTVNAPGVSVHVVEQGYVEPVYVETRYVEPVYGPVVMDSGTFESFLQQMKDASFADDKHALLRTSVVHNSFSCAQLSRILDVYSFDDDKVEAVGIVRPSIVDPENSFVLNDRFSFSDDAQRAQRFFR